VNYTQFFDDFVSKYPIYQDNRVFQILLNKFKDTFLLDTYEDIPHVFKSLYEKGEITSDVYDYFLVNIGVSNDLITTLTTQEKLIFIKSLADFQKYKGTVGLIKNIIQAYGDGVEAYELYVDYNTVQSKWECKPYLIYKPTSSDGYNTTIPYKTVYEKIPSLLISEKQLDQMRESKLAIFPIKTNVVFVTSNYNQSITSYLQNLIIGVFYNTFKNDVINLYFDDELITCSLHQFILIWMYLIFTMNTTANIDCKTTGLSIVFDDNVLAANISIDDLDGIIEEYENISNDILAKSSPLNAKGTTPLDDFYFKYIYPQQSELTSLDSTLDLNKIKNWLRTENPTLINYIDNKLAEPDSSVTLLFNDLIQSIEDYRQTSLSVNFDKYFSYFKTFLPTVDLLPIKSTVFKILYYTKPFHTELLDLTNLSLILSNDTFNNVFFTHLYHASLFFEECDIIEQENIHSLTMLKNHTDGIPIISCLNPKRIQIPITDNYSINITDDYDFLGELIVDTIYTVDPDGNYLSDPDGSYIGI
jgi:hypothetical protein